jgi:predicted hydrocarbon binding protein
MKGIMFNLLEEVVSRQFGPETWDDLLDGVGAAGAYTSLGNYPDEDLDKLLAAAAVTLKVAPAEALRWFGRQAMPVLAERFPSFFEGHQSARHFILSVNSIIHPEVRKLYPNAHCPNFQFHEEADGALVMGYQSPRKMCDIAHGFIEGASAHFKERAAIRHLACMKRGDEQCRVEIRWSH